METKQQNPFEASSSQKTSQMSIKKEDQPEEIKGRAIIQNYIMMRYGSMPKYKQLCAALDTYVTWSEESRTSFLEQFMDSYDIMDVNCGELVYKLCNIKWNLVPTPILHNFVNFLTALAINHIHHISQVFTTFIDHFGALVVEEAKGEYALEMDEQSQESLYEMVHFSIKSIVASNPLSVPILLKCCMKQFPHIRNSAPKLLSFVRNIIHLANWMDDEEVAAELWSLIINKLLHMDASFTGELQDEEQRLSFCSHADYNTRDHTSHFNDEEEEEAIENPMELKLDALISLVLAYLGGTNCNGTSPFKDDPNFKAIQSEREICNPKMQEKMFKMLLESFDEHVLATLGMHSTPFIWFYLCSLSKENCTLMLEYLWEVLQLPTDSPNEWRKANNAAAFLCGFLARANYVDFELSCHWMRKISRWCREYVACFVSSKNTYNYGIQHGTFYAVVQSLLFIFCYRHGEVQENDAFDEVRSWQLDKIVYSQLEPLRWVSQGVALCFLAVNRHLKLIRQNHNLLELSTQSTSRKRKRTPLELFFPFSFCSLPTCSSLVLPLMRRFSPIQMPISAPLTTSDKLNELEEKGQQGWTNEADEENETKTEEMEEETKQLFVPKSDPNFEEKSEIELNNNDDEDDETVSDESNMPVDEGYEEELMFGQAYNRGSSLRSKRKRTMGEEMGTMIP